MSRSGEELTVASSEREATAREATRPGTTAATEAPRPREAIFDVDDVSVFYGEKRAIRNVSLAAAAIVVLMVVLLLMNSVAIFLRNRYEQKW